LSVYKMLQEVKMCVIYTHKTNPINHK